MGMYTGLRAKVVVKPEWREAIALLHELRKSPNPDCAHNWTQLHRAHPDVPGLNGWVKVWRQDFIPFGGLCYMPDDFSEAGNDGYSKFDPATGLWQFCCSLKNYEGEIQFFVKNVLAPITESFEYCESLYEETAYDMEGDNSSWRERTTKYDLSLAG